MDFNLVVLEYFATFYVKRDLRRDFASLVAVFCGNR